jgi:hypothetical protein
MPTDQPEAHLVRAIEAMNSMDIDRAIQMGARVDHGDRSGRSSLHVLLDKAIAPDGHTIGDPRRVLACAQALMRNNADVMRPHPVSRLSALVRAAAMASHPIACQWYGLLRHRGDWNRPAGRNEQSAREAWEANASPELARVMGLATKPEIKTKTAPKP